MMIPVNVGSGTTVGTGSTGSCCGGMINLSFIFNKKFILIFLTHLIGSSGNGGQSCGGGKTNNKLFQ